MIRLQKIKQLTGHKASVFALSKYLDEHSFLSAAGDGWIVTWNLNNPDTGKLIAKVDTQVFALCYLPDGHRVVAGDMNGGVHWIDLDDPDNSYDWAHHKKGVFDLQPIDDWVYSVGGDGLLTRWNRETARSVESVQLSHSALRCLEYDPLRKLFFAGSSDNSIYALRSDDLSLAYRVADAHHNSVFSIRVHPDGKHLISGGRDAHLNIWEINEHSMHLVKSLPAHWYTLNNLAFHPEGHWFASGSRDRTVKVWDAYTFELIQVLETARDGGHINSVNRLLWSDHHNTLISASDDRSMILWA